MVGLIIESTVATAPNVNGAVNVGTIIGSIWEIFVGLLPLTVALLTIYLNEKRLKRQQDRVDMQKDIATLEKMVLELHSLEWDAGKNLLESMQQIDPKESEQYFAEYYKLDKDMLSLARRINGYATIRKIVYREEKFDFSEMFEKTKDYAKKLTDIYEWFYRIPKAIANFREERLDDAQEKLIQASVEFEESIIQYCAELQLILRKSKDEKR